MNRKGHTVRFLRVAEDDLTEIVRYIAADRPSAAEAIAAKIEKSLQLLSKNPTWGESPRKRNSLNSDIGIWSLTTTSSFMRSNPSPSLSTAFCTAPVII